MAYRNFKIRVMNRADLDIAINWAAIESWNPGLHDADCFYATDPNGFFLGVFGDEPVACISAVAYNESFGFLGLYIVKPEHRGKGYGIQMWNKALGYLKTQNIGLDGVLAQQENYKKSGFKLAYRNIRYQGVSIKTNNRIDIVKLSDISFKDILKYDNMLFPTPRPQFLNCWVKLPESTALGVLKDNTIIGYGVIRKCRKGYKIGPLFANNNNVAEKLFFALNNYADPNSPLFLDVPETNQVAIKLAECLNMAPIFETARMYTKEQPKLPMHKMFGVTSFELG